MAGLLHRVFQSCGLASDTKGIVVMQFNVLADGMGEDQFKHLLAAEFVHPHRFELALLEVDRVEPDVICLQEVNHFHDFWEKS